MTPDDFGTETAEPMVGEVTALRSFRITDDGYFLPLTDAGGHQPWPTETSSAKCARDRPHKAPDPDCTCGFYAYGNRSWIEREGQYNWSRLVLAAVHCSGRLVAGEKGLRGEKMRLVACYVSKGLPKRVRELLHEHYPEVEFFPSRKALLTAHPETPLSTYNEPPKARKFDIPTAISGLQIALAFAAIPLMLGMIALAFVGENKLTYGAFVSAIFAILVWFPFILEGWVALKVGVFLDRLESMNRAIHVPWTRFAKKVYLSGPFPRIIMIILSLPLIYIFADKDLRAEGWVPVAFGIWVVGVAWALWMETRRALPLDEHFPLVPRTMAIRKLRDSLPADVTPGRQSSHRHRAGGEEGVMEAFDMGGYGIGVVHYGIFSDPEDHLPAFGSAPDLKKGLSMLMESLGIPGDRWVAYLASEGATMRAFSPQGAVSVPVSLAEIDAILPFPTRAWCAPSIRAAYASKVASDDSFCCKDREPLTLPAGYRDGRLDGDSFSDPSIGNALAIARRISEQSAYRSFKEIEADLPEGLEPLATPLLPNEKGGTADNPAAEMSKALTTLMDSPAELSTAKRLAFTMGELTEALSSSTDDLNTVMSIEHSLSKRDAPQDSETGMKGGHLLLLSTFGATVSGTMGNQMGMLTMLSYDDEDGRVYGIFEGDKKHSFLNSTLHVRKARSDSGNDDDVDSLKDAEK